MEEEILVITEERYYHYFYSMMTSHKMMMLCKHKHRPAVLEDFFSIRRLFCDNFIILHYNKRTFFYNFDDRQELLLNYL
ncbi:MAG: hypothetical protein JXA99_16285 [Candidatus Lokiarchaeota archaeon]|nr:hypothetical protein [Candidatus Lokiarchaeota archaeon]